MCESLPSAWLAKAREELRRTAGSMSRRSVLTGLGGLFLAGCMPASAAERRREAATIEIPEPVRPRRPARPPIRIVRREAWGASPLRDNHDPMARIRRLTVHHTAELPDMSASTDTELMKGIQTFHQDGRGWADIGYHWVIGRHGHIYEGRALDVQGAHAGGGNNIENLGISIMGDFSTQMPSTAALRSLTLFLRVQQKRYGIAMDQVFGHREFKATACPGDALFAWLERYRATT